MNELLMILLHFVKDPYCLKSFCLITSTDDYMIEQLFKDWVALLALDDACRSIETMRLHRFGQFFL